MARFELVTGQGNYQRITAATLEEAAELGLGHDPKQLSGLYNALVGAMPRFFDENNQPIDGARTVVPTRNGEGKWAPIVGADQALVATEILRGRTHPKTEIVGIGFDGGAVSINKAFKADPRRDRPYLHGFLNVLRFTSTNLGYEMPISNDDESIEGMVSGDITVGVENPENGHILRIMTAEELYRQEDIKAGYIATSPDTILFIPSVIRGDEINMRYGAEDPNQYKFDI